MGGHCFHLRADRTGLAEVELGRTASAASEPSRSAHRGESSHDEPVAEAGYRDRCHETSMQSSHHGSCQALRVVRPIGEHVVRLARCRRYSHLGGRNLPDRHRLAEVFASLPWFWSASGEVGMRCGVIAWCLVLPVAARGVCACC